MTAKVRIIQSKTVSGFGVLNGGVYDFDVTLDAVPQDGNTMFCVCILDGSSGMDSIVQAGATWYDINDDISGVVNLTTYFAQEISSAAQTLTIKIDANKEAKFYLYEIEGLVKTPTWVVMDSDSVTDAVTPTSQILTSVGLSNVKFVAMAYVGEGTDDFTSPVRPTGATYLDYAAVDDEQFTFAASGSKIVASVLFGFTTDLAIDTSMGWTDVGGDNGMLAQAIAFGTDAPLPFSITEVSPVGSPLSGGTKLTITGDFSDILGQALRVKIGSGLDTDDDCLPGVAGQGLDIYAVSASTIECYLPNLLEGGPYTVTVDAADDSYAGILRNQVTTYKDDFKTGVFGYRSSFPPTYRMGPRNTENLPEV